ncbi:hypothetical protein GGU10DRAFT_337590 [Lentinula aff. detonsa]|uniref:Uncharacterized protein n=1 Tax=Lentinula aff. detonsa TaxID=2804958 RepID=A0AA38NIZ4_9AGAR|nr:hypothetical protein GGU10DRAFT_337590 [Lentinula aff. detonsa]
MRTYGFKTLKAFRYKIWDASMSPQIEMLPPAALLPDSTIGSMLDQFVKLKTLEDISSYVNCFLSGHEEELLDQLQLLRVKFNRMKIGLDPNEIAYDNSIYIQAELFTSSCENIAVTACNAQCFFLSTRPFTGSGDLISTAYTCIHL